MTALTRIDSNIEPLEFSQSVRLFADTINVFAQLAIVAANLGTWSRNRKAYRNVITSPALASICRSMGLSLEYDEQAGYILDMKSIGIEVDDLFTQPDGEFDVYPSSGVIIEPLSIELSNVIFFAISDIDSRMIEIERTWNECLSKEVPNEFILDNYVRIHPTVVPNWLEIINKLLEYRAIQFQPYLSPQMNIPYFSRTIIDIPDLFSLNTYEVLRERRRLGDNKNEALAVLPNPEEIISNIKLWRKSCDKHLRILDGESDARQLLSPNRNVNDEVTVLPYNPDTMITKEEICAEYKSFFGSEFSIRQASGLIAKYKIPVRFEKKGKGGYKAYDRPLAMAAIMEKAKSE